MDIDIPHSLGRDEAKRRVEAGLPKLEKHIPSGGTVSAMWPEPYRLDMRIDVMGQSIPTTLWVEDAHIRASVSVPMMLKMMSGPISDFIRGSAQKMLAAPAA
ncbi:MAG: hypothetical protein DI606_07255 [Sphingobium sp.]|uniref:polyhydroxyalkanoic acid system family protein n=1 Tax=Sphingobium sp. TaxID=1912891 RepID=UPI000DB50C26|nr:polyhydroxyalkanoic acid system family protein [Sphingobium sp.]PZU12948.1 MAG: hypothetical protein DI606_07255 [Sphingobium sp.]